MLNSHGHILAYGEIFLDKIIDWNIERKVEDENKLLKFRNESPVEFLEKEVFKNFQLEIEAVGFKLFYYHAQTFRTLWDYLRSSHDIHFIHLKRQNILRTFLSHQRAMHTGKWELDQLANEDKRQKEF